MRHWIKIIIMTFCSFLILLSLYFTFVLITSGDKIQEAYEQMNGGHEHNTDGAKGAFIKLLVEITGDESIYYRVGIAYNDSSTNSGPSDSDPGTGENEDNGSDDPNDPSNPNPPGPNPGPPSGPPQDVPNAGEGTYGEKYSVHGFRSVTQGSLPNLYSSGKSSFSGKGCFFVAVTAAINGSGKSAALCDVFSADGGTVSKKGNNYYYSKDYTGGDSRAISILSKFGISAHSESVSQSGMYIVYITNDSQGKYSSSGNHWFVINNGYTYSEIGGKNVPFHIDDWNYFSSHIKHSIKVG